MKAKTLAINLFLFLALIMIYPTAARAQDADLDGMPDTWEFSHPCLNAAVPDGNLDPDADALTSLQEYLFSPLLDPCALDTDGDVIRDGLEVILGSNPLDPGIVSRLFGIMVADVNGLIGGTLKSMVWTGSEYVFLSDAASLSFTRISSDGVRIGSIINFGYSGVSGGPSLVWTGSEFGAAYYNSRYGSHEIYFMRLSPEGALVGTELRVTNNTVPSVYPSLVWTGSGFGLSWEEEVSGVPQIFFTRISADGTKLGGDTRVFSANRASYPSLAWTGSEFGVAWQDYVSFTYNIYFTRFSTDGTWQGDNVLIAADVTQAGPELAWAGSQYGIAWGTGLYLGLIFRLMSPEGVLQGQELTLSKYYTVRNPALIWTGSEFGASWDTMNFSVAICLPPDPCPPTTYYYTVEFARITLPGPTSTGRLTLASNTNIGYGYPSIAWSGTEFAGHFWNGNSHFYRIGWDDGDGDNLTRSQETTTGTNSADWDTDGDGMSDGWEAAHACMNPAVSDPPDGDSDGDGLTNILEYAARSNPCGPDSDGDGVGDLADCGPTDPNNWVSCATCVDLDGDSRFVNCDAYATILGPDCSDATPNAWNACATCVDLDSDLSLVGCDAYVTAPGPDCNDTNPHTWTTCATCADTDGDSWFGTCNDYTGINGPDCNDFIPDVWNTCATCMDADLDGHYLGCNTYTILPGPDCNDANMNAWDTCATCIDSDSDGWWGVCNRYISEVTDEFGTGTIEWELPMGTYYHDARTQVIYLASEVGPAKTINAIGLDVTLAPGQIMNNFTIRMKHTSLAVTSTWEGPASGWTTVYQANETPGGIGWRTFTFTTPFDYNGVSNLMIDFSFNNNSYTDDGLVRSTQVTSYRSVCYQTDSEYGNPLDWTGFSNPSPDTWNLIPNIRFITTNNSILGPDCNDAAITIYPGAPEVCDTIDNQCPGDTGYGEIDEGCPPPDADGDGLSDGQEIILGTDPNVADSDGDGLNDGLEYLTLGTDPLYWDTDGDALPDAFEVANLSGHTAGMNLNPLAVAGATADFDADGNSNVNEYWNATSAWAADPVGEAGCFFWGDANGDGYIGPPDNSALTASLKGSAVDYSMVIPDTGETQDLNADTYYGPPDLALLAQFMKGTGITSMPSRPTGIEQLSSGPTSVKVGDTTHLTVGLRNTAGLFTPGFGVVFTIDPTSTGTATILGGDGADPSGYRFDVSGTVTISASSRVVIRVDSAGEIKINASTPQCGEVLNMGRYCDALNMPAPFIITGHE